MSEKPLGRDRLGRLVYEGDVADCAIPTRVVIAPNGDQAVTGPCDYIKVNIALSPKRSNFERYFADLGEFEFIRRVALHTCIEMQEIGCYEEGCPLALWGVECWVTFVDWLQQEATV